MTSPPSEFSRIAATASSLGSSAQDAHTFTSKAVLLTGDPLILATANGKDCFLNAIRLLTRMVDNLTIQVLESPQLLAEAKTLVSSLAFRVSPKVIAEREPNLRRFDAILSIGITSSCDLPITVINSNGWVARVGSGGNSISSICNQRNPIGSLAAASLGAGEVFKRLIRLKPERGDLHQKLCFSFFSYTCEEVFGNPLAPTEIGHVALCGAGAIGNAIAHLLDSLPLSGQIRIVDRDTYKIENWGTCLTLQPSQFLLKKAEVLSNSFQASLRAIPYSEPVEVFKSRCGKEFPYPYLIINGFDNVAARRSVQDLWPDQMIDGAIGPVSCEVTLHPWGPDLSCLKCDFIEPAVNAVDQQIRATGLPATLLFDQSRTLTEDDLKLAAPEKLQWLKGQTGKSLCSIVQEAILAMLSSDSQDKGFEPSVPFVASLSACMVVTELVRYVQGLPTPLETGFQFDLMVGPQNGQQKAHGRKADCTCVTRAKNIEAFRRTRQTSTCLWTVGQKPNERVRP